ncbi:MAG: hypothetical protein ABI811_10965 [Acidobacteriota bacterium]
MHLEAFLWLFLPVFVAGGSALLSYFIMQSRMEVALAKERESLAEARATINSNKVTMEERIKATQEATRRAALEEMMQDFRVEERSFVRDSISAVGARRSMVMQERVFFRNIPMSGWTEREMLIEEGPTGTLSGRTPELASSSPAPARVSAAGMSTQSAAPIAIDSQRRFAPPPAEEPRLAVSKGLDPVAVPPAPRHRQREGQFRDTRTLVPAHAGFGAQ